MEILLLQWHVKKQDTNHIESIITSMQYKWKAMPGEKKTRNKVTKN